MRKSLLVFLIYAATFAVGWLLRSVYGLSLWWYLVVAAVLLPVAVVAERHVRRKPPSHK